MVGRFNCLACANAVNHCIDLISNWQPVVWVKNLKTIRKLRLGGIVLSCLATCLVMIAISTEYWVKRFVRGIFVFRGLWKDCQLGKCTALVKMPFSPYTSQPLRMPAIDVGKTSGENTSGTWPYCPENMQQPCDPSHESLRQHSHTDYIVFSILFMLISAVTCYGSVIFGTLCLTALPPSKKIKWTTLTITLCFVSGFTGGIGLFNFMRLSTEEPNTFLSWSLAPGWFSVIIVLFAGVCHFVARNWEEEELAQTLLGTTVVFTLQEDCVARAASEEAQQKRKRLPESDTSA